LSSSPLPPSHIPLPVPRLFSAPPPDLKNTQFRRLGVSFTSHSSAPCPENCSLFTFETILPLPISRLLYPNPPPGAPFPTPPGNLPIGQHPRGTYAPNQDEVTLFFLPLSPTCGFLLSASFLSPLDFSSPNIILSLATIIQSDHLPPPSLLSPTFCILLFFFSVCATLQLALNELPSSIPAVLRNSFFFSLKRHQLSFTWTHCHGFYQSDGFFHHWTLLSVLHFTPSQGLLPRVSLHLIETPPCSSFMRSPFLFAILFPPPWTPPRAEGKVRLSASSPQTTNLLLACFLSWVYLVIPPP